MAEQVVLLLLACAVLFAAAFMGWLTALQYRNMLRDADWELQCRDRAAKHGERIHKGPDFEFPKAERR